MNTVLSYDEHSDGYLIIETDHYFFPSIINGKKIIGAKSNSFLDVNEVIYDYDPYGEPNESYPEISPDSYLTYMDYDNIKDFFNSFDFLTDGGAYLYDLTFKDIINNDSIAFFEKTIVLGSNLKIRFIYSLDKDEFRFENIPVDHLKFSILYNNKTVYSHNIGYIDRSDYMFKSNIFIPLFNFLMFFIRYNKISYEDIQFDDINFIKDGCSSENYLNISHKKKLRDLFDWIYLQQEQSIPIFFDDSVNKYMVESLKETLNDMENPTTFFDMSLEFKWHEDHYHYF